MPASADWFVVVVGGGVAVVVGISGVLALADWTVVVDAVVVAVVVVVVAGIIGYLAMTE